jgi:HEAT repeat protein
MSESHTDIRVHLGRQGVNGTYPVAAELDDGSIFTGGELGIQMEDLLATVLDPKAYGLDLFDALMSGPIRRAYDKVTGRAERETGGRVRVRLWIDDQAAELHAIPWERLYHIHRGHEVALAASVLTPFSRYTGLEIGEGEAVTGRPLRLLFAVANPKGLPPLLAPIKVEQEVADLHAALSDLQRTGQLEITILPGQTGLSQELKGRLEREGYRIATGSTTLAQLQDLLPSHHVFHLLAHGQFHRRDRHGEGVAYLHLEQADGTWEPVADDEVVSGLVRMERLPRLMFLAACESAQRVGGAENPFVGLGPKLVKAGVPAVVAMQDVVSMEIARRLTGHFYRQLLEHGVVDRALNEARSHVFDAERIDWAIPVLFMRLRTGELITPDPVRTALQTILKRYETDRPPLAVEVTHLAELREPSQVEQVDERGVPALDLLKAVDTVFAEPDPEVPSQTRNARLIVLVGAYGMAKTTQLLSIASRTAAQSLSDSERQPIIPLYVDLRAYTMGRSASVSPVEARVLECLAEFWPDLDVRSLADLPLRERGLQLRLLFDGTDDLAHDLRSHAWRGIQELATRYPQDQYLLAIDADRYIPRLLQDATDLLVVRSLSLRAIERFLKDRRNEPYGSRLYEALGRKQLFDLASIPWLLASMLEQARQGLYPNSRAVVLDNLVEDAIAEIPTERGMRSRARPTLYALAWAMQSGRKRVLGAKETFEIMSAVRANREYSLEDLVDALVGADLIVRVGEDSIRFYYPAYQAYCAARAIADSPERDQILDDIAALLGRLTQLRWWEGTLILLSGLLPRARVLHRKLLYGANLNEGEEIFLIVRCLLESGDQQIVDDVRNQVVDALVWQLDTANVGHSARRVRVAHALGQLRNRAAIPYLVNAATQRVRLNWEGELAYDLTNVRMAAAVALQRMMPAFGGEIRAADAQLAHLLRLWGAQKVAELKEHLMSGDIVSRAIAAAALADLQTKEAIDALIEAVSQSSIPADTSWALTDALALLDPVRVTQEVIVPFIERRVAHWYERLAYLIGKIRAQDPVALAFLDRCLHDLTRVETKAKAIQSVGWLQDRTKTRLLEYVAMGRFDEIDSAAQQEIKPADEPEDQALKRGFKLGKVTPLQLKYLRLKAIEALAYIGDAESLSLLREGRMEWDWELRQAFYWTSEEIYWREQVQRQQ